MSLLERVADGHASEDTPAFVRSWLADFDYLYVVGPSAPNALPTRLEQIETNPRFTLYRIRKTQGAKPRSG